MEIAQRTLRVLGVRDDADQPPALVVEDLPGSATSAGGRSLGPRRPGWGKRSARHQPLLTIGGVEGYRWSIDTTCCDPNERQDDVEQVDARLSLAPFSLLFQWRPRTTGRPQVLTSRSYGEPVNRLSTGVLLAALALGALFALGPASAANSTGKIMFVGGCAGPARTAATRASS